MIQDDEDTRFWTGLQNLVAAEVLDKLHANKTLVEYVKRATDAYNTYIVSEKDLFRMSMIFTDSVFFSGSKEFCIGKLLSLMNIDLLDINMKFIIVYILLCESRRNRQSLQMMQDFQGFTVFYNALYTQFAYLKKYGETSSQQTDIETMIIEEMKKISTVLMDLLFLMFKYGTCQLNNVQIIDEFFVYYIISSIRSDTLDDTFNNTQFKLILALNERYMMFTKNYELENKVYKYVLNTTISQSFIELLLLKFNRATYDPSLQIMMCKIIYIILTETTHDVAYNFFYLNDLHVFVDVLIRELQNFSDHQENLRNTYLRVLAPLLANTELSHTHYRKMDIYQLLTHLSSTDNFVTSTTITKEQTETAFLASQCLHSIKWLQNVSSEPSSQSSSESPTEEVTRQMYRNRKLDFSAESLSKRKSIPIPPPPRKLTR